MVENKGHVLLVQTALVPRPLVDALPGPRTLCSPEERWRKRHGSAGIGGEDPPYFRQRFRGITRYAH